MKLRPLILIVALALFIQEVRHFIEIGGLSNQLALSLGKLCVYCMTVALIGLDYSTGGTIWAKLDLAMRMTT